MGEFNWTCPFCGTAQTVSGAKSHRSIHTISVGETAYRQDIAGDITAIGCSNPECKKVKITFTVGTVRSRSNYDHSPTSLNELIHRDIVPESIAKPQPDYIPLAIVSDYYEAARIVELSPKASATLARRCIQGMIRDFCSISRATLHQEINELRRQFEADAAPRGVSEESFAAIEAIRKVGNIGAHMEKEIDVIVEVDSGEAQLLLGLVEMLFEDWYVARNKRRERLAEVDQIVRQKETARKKLERIDQEVGTK